MEMEASNQYLGTERVGKLMARYAVPCIISLLVGALYNIVDQIFIANASYLGSYGNAANTVVFPLTVVALALAVMVGDGCCAFVSLSLGKGEKDRARKSVGNAIVMSVGSGIVLMAVYLIFQTPIIAMFGGTVNEETFAYSREYFFYICSDILGDFSGPEICRRAFRNWKLKRTAVNETARKSATGSARYTAAAWLAGKRAGIM